MPADVALERFRELDPTVPVIIISGAQDEEAARAIEAAVAKAIGEGRATRDVGGKLGTIAAGAAIAEILQAG